MVVKVVKNQYITKKMPRSVDPKLKQLQAQYQLAYGKRVSEGRLVEMAVDEALAHSVLTRKGDGRGVLAIAGMFKGRKGMNVAKELDDVVYGV